MNWKRYYDILNWPLRQAMKYKIILNILSWLIRLKRLTWWFGGQTHGILAKIFGPIIRLVGYFVFIFRFKLSRKLGVNTGLNRKLFKRDNLQIIILFFLFFLALPQTKIYSKSDNLIPGQDTIAYTLVKGPEELGRFEEVYPDNSVYSATNKSGWKAGSLSSEDYVATDYLQHQIELAAGFVAGGTAHTNPIIFPGANAVGSDRTTIIDHTVLEGETVGAIALQYGISVASVLWENNLTALSYIRPGDVLRILPVSGIRHTVVSGDTLIKIAGLYGGQVSQIASFNKLKADGSNLRVGQIIIIPDGVKYYAPTQATASYIAPASNYSGKVPASSSGSPSVSGFVWPSALHMITQYYSWAHPAIDVSGPVGRSYGTAIYAAKSGTVEVATQSGWNYGYGNYIIINHGGGYKTLYGHNSTVLVSPGDYVVAGQTISLMGNTGRVYGIDGVHLHFELQVNGINVNPLNYVR